MSHSHQHIKSRIFTINIIPSGKQQTPFQQSHIIEFELKIMKQDLINQIILFIHYQFCIFHDREEFHFEKIRKYQKIMIIKS